MPSVMPKPERLLIAMTLAAAVGLLGCGSGGPTADFYVAADGADGNPGTEAKPWKTINHALTRLNPGDTLYLRGGVFFENVTCAVAGTKKKPITIRSYPGELAVIDASLREFEEAPRKSSQLFSSRSSREFTGNSAVNWHRLRATQRPLKRHVHTWNGA